MENLTFDKLPEAIGRLFDRLDRIETLISQSKLDHTSEREDTILSVSEAGVFLNLKVPTIYGLVSRASIPHSKVGKKLYFSKHELIDWVKAGRKITATEAKAKANEFLQLRKK